MKTIFKEYQTQNEFHRFVITSYSDLIEMKKEGNKTAFNELMLQVLPQVKIYISQKLNKAIKNGGIAEGKYKSDDFVDDLYIKTFDHINEIEDEKDFHLWLFKKADELLADAITEEEFDDLFFKNIDNYAKPEWDAMEENYSTDGGGDLVMIEELDDASYYKNNYTLKDIFIDNEEEQIVRELDEKLSEEKINRHVQMVVQKLPLRMQTVFDLVANHQFEPVDIAKIKNIQVPEVIELLSTARKLIKASFKQRFTPISE